MESTLEKEIRQEYHKAKAAIEKHGLTVQMLYLPISEPSRTHQLHMQASKAYPVNENGMIETAMEVLFAWRSVVSGEIGAYALAAFILEEWLELLELFILEKGEL